MIRFNPLFYRDFRPFYPPETFTGLRDALLKSGFHEPFTTTDLGCGTGHSSISLLRAGILAELIGIDPDPEMLKEAQDLANQNEMTTIKWQVGSGEVTHLADQSTDVILMGSSLHWMDGHQTNAEVRRILRPNGILWIFEYQFPKAPALPELNE